MQKLDLPATLSNAQHIILFDGVCRLCSGWVFFVMQHDPQGRFKFASVQSATGQTLLRHLGLPTDKFDTMVYIQNRQAYYRSTAFLKIIPAFGWHWRLLSTIGLLTPRLVRDWLYNRIALNRYTLFGKRQSCLVPTPDIEARFL